MSLLDQSKVLNGRTDVSPPTRASRRCSPTAVPAVAPPADAAELIELVFHELDPIWSMEVIDGVEDVAKQHGLSRAHRERQPARARPRLDRGRDAPPAGRRDPGVLRPRARVPRAAALAGIPFVIVDPAGDPSPDAPSVGSANWSGGLTATRHLIELGHRRIAAITGPEDMMCSLARVDGYRSAMNSAGLPIDASGSGSATSTSRRPRPRARAARPRRPAHGDLRRQRPAGARRDRRRASAASACPRTCRSSATTTSRSRAG